MGDELLQTLLARQAPPQPVAIPTPHPVVPPAAKRAENAQAIISAYQSGQPNPVLLRAMLGNMKV